MITPDPQTTFKVVLDCHKGMTPEPYFLCRYMSARRRRLAQSQFQSFTTNDDGDEAYAAILELARLNVIDWAGQKSLDEGEDVVFDLSRIDEICGPQELMELIVKKLVAQRLSSDDKKKLESPSAIDTAADAKAVADPQSANTN